jgi:hypothetical protein
MIRQLEAEDSEDRDLILQIIINLSGEENFQKTFISLNTIYRMCYLFMQRVEKELDSNRIEGISQFYELRENKNKIDIKLILEKYVINPESINTGSLNEIPYYFMILTNLTISEEGQNKFLNLEDDKIQGIIFMKILDKYFQYIYNEEFNFCSNLIANISSIKEGRVMILEYKIFKILLIHFDKLNNFKIINTLRIIRNCSFEYEAFKDELLINDTKLFSYLIKILVLTNITDKKELQNIGISHIDEIYFPNFKPELAYQEKENINDLIFDIFLIFTNFEKGIDEMKNKDLYKAIQQVKSRLGEDENLKDRLFVINNYLEN